MNTGIKNKIIRRLAWSALVMLAFSTCDNRKPLLLPVEETEVQSLIFLGDSVHTYADSLVVNIRVTVLNENRGVIDSGLVNFSAQLGFISGAVRITDGVALAYYHPKKLNFEFIDTVKAFFIHGQKRDTLWGSKTITILPREQTDGGSVGAIRLRTSTPQLRVKGAGGLDQALISAAVSDEFGSPVKDGIPITFQILSAPGGSEILNDVGKVDTASTQDGIAQVTLHSGTSVGIIEIKANGPGNAAPVILTLSVTSGPPAKIDIDLLENKVLREGGRWKMPVHAILTDLYSNPVEDSISVIFFLWAGLSVDQKILIQNSGLTGVNLKGNADTIPGVAVSWITFDSEVIFDSILIWATTLVNQDSIISGQWFTIPLPPAEVKAEYFGGVIQVTRWDGMDSAHVKGILQDDEFFPIPGGRLCAISEVGAILDTLGVINACGITDNLGQVRFIVSFEPSDQISPLAPIQTNVVTVIEPTIQKQSKVSFQLKFQ